MPTQINLFEQVRQFYIGTQAAVEALTGVQQGALGYATDISKFGSYNGATWDWLSASAGAGHTIQDEGISLTARTKLNFIGAGVTAADNAGAGSTDVTIPGGGFTQEEIEDFIGAMVSGNTETGIDVTYDDAGGKLNFDAQTAGDARYAPIAKGVTNGDTHDHNGGDGNQIAYSTLSGLPTLGTAADNAETDFAVAAKGVTNGDSHDHVGGDGAQIDHGGTGGLGDDDHTQYHNDTRGDARYLKYGFVALTNDITPTTLGSSVTDYNPTGLSTADVLRLSASTDVFIRGLAGASDGRVILIQNVGTANNITLIDEDISNPTATNRFWFSEDASMDTTLRPDHSMVVIYDSTKQRWRPFTDRDAGSLQGVPVAEGLSLALHDGYALSYDSFQNVFLNDVKLDHDNAIDNVGVTTHAQIDTYIGTTAPATFAPIAKGVTNGDTHDHSGGDGNQIDYNGLANLPTRREVLSGARTYYVRTDGNDSNTGLTNSAGGAFLTIQRAVNVAATLDFSTNAVTIQVGNGTYTGAVVIQPWVGSGGLTIQGDTTTPANVLLNITANNIFYIAGMLPGILTIQGFKLQSTGGDHISHYGTGTIQLGNNTYHSCGNFQIAAAAPGAYINIIASYTVTGNATCHWLANAGGNVTMNGSLTVTFTGTLTYTFTAYATRTGVISIASITRTVSGGSSVTAQRYNADFNGVIYTGAGGATYIPGSTNGATATGGQYG